MRHRMEIYEKNSSILIQNDTLSSTQDNVDAITAEEIVSMLLLMSQLELRLKNLVSRLLKSKHQIWNNCQAQATTIMLELSYFFSGEHSLNNVKKNEGLMKWFASMNEEIQSLTYDTNQHVTITS